MYTTTLKNKARQLLSEGSMLEFKKWFDSLGNSEKKLIANLLPDLKETSLMGGIYDAYYI